MFILKVPVSSKVFFPCLNLEVGAVESVSEQACWAFFSGAEQSQQIRQLLLCPLASASQHVSFLIWKTGH